MRSSILLIIAISAIFFNSCEKRVYNNSKGFEEILIDAKNQTSLSLDSIIKDIDYIKLETTDDNLIGQVSRIFFIDSLLVVADCRVSMTVQVYDITGDFKYTLGRKGNGPGEYVEVSHVCIDYQKKHVVILDRSQKRIIRYNLDGSFVSMERTPFQLVYFEFLGTGSNVYYKSALFDPEYGAFKNKQLVVTDSLNRVLHGDFLDLYKPGIFMYEMNLPLRTFGNSVYYSPLLSNLIYTVTDDKFIPKYHLNIAWNGMPPVNDQITGDIFQEYCEKYYIFNGDFIELQDLTYINIMTPVGYPFVVYSHAKKKTFFCTDQGANPLFPFLKDTAPKSRYKENSIVFDVNPYSLIMQRKELYRLYPKSKEWLDDLYQGLSENSNPVILLCHLNKNI